jgi:hypothetical protein
MKLDSFIALIKELRTNAITDDDVDPANTLLQEYTSPYDQVSMGESIRAQRFSPTSQVWGDGTTYTAYDQQGNAYQAPSCGWYWGSGGAWVGTVEKTTALTLWPVIYIRE